MVSLQKGDRCTITADARYNNTLPGMTCIEVSINDNNAQVSIEDTQENYKINFRKKGNSISRYVLNSPQGVYTKDLVPYDNTSPSKYDHVIRKIKQMQYKRTLQGYKF